MKIIYFPAVEKDKKLTIPLKLSHTKWFFNFHRNKSKLFCKEVVNNILKYKFGAKSVYSNHENNRSQKSFVRAPWIL